MIKAFHQVGGDDRTAAERRAFLDQILELGEIVPAIERVQRSEMYAECFTDEAQGGHNVPSLARGLSDEVHAALAEMASEELNELPQVGSTHTMFNCLDLIAGDFDLIFLSVGDWHSYPNGFVFDAEKLLMDGARYREQDLLGYYARKVEEVGQYTYDSVADAKYELKRALRDVQRHFETKGKMATTLIRADCPRTCPGEIVWPGRLPVSRAIEVWREGKLVKTPKRRKAVPSW